MATEPGLGMLRRDGHSEAWQHQGQPLGQDREYCGGAATGRHDGTTVWLIPVGIMAVLRIRDFYPGSRILIFTHPGSRNPGPKNSNKREG
jgi:hypothetical protein